MSVIHTLFTIALGLFVAVALVLGLFVTLVVAAIIERVVRR